jgi:hypothetical protein
MLPDRPIIPPNHCKHCPTAIGIRQGHDPESCDILRSRSSVEAEISDGSNIYCPWRSAPCIVFPVELQWAKQWHDAGDLPPVQLADRFKD